MNKTVCISLAALAAFTCSAVDKDGYYVYDAGGSGGWADGSRWYDGVAPDKGGKVKLSASNCIATVSDSDLETVTNLSEIVIHGTEGVKLVFDISQDVHIPCRIQGFGQIVKNGTGTLWLDNIEKTGSYKTQDGIVVNAGALHLPTRASASTSDMQFGVLTVNSPGVLYLVDGCNTLAAGLAGDGFVSNLCTVALASQNDNQRQLKLDGNTTKEPCVFSGDIGPYISVTMSGGTQHFTRTDVARSTTVRLYSGILGVTALGRTAGDSISTGEEFNMRGSSGTTFTLLYLGTGGVCSHTLKFYTDTYGFILDGGPHGGLNVTGGLRPGSAECMSRFTLAGDHTNACVISGEVREANDLSTSTYVTKVGSGTWRFQGSPSRRDCNGVFAVKAGTLEFDSIAERGIQCSLGFQSLWHEDYIGARNDNRVVPYAFLLGDGGSAVAATNGTLSYVGTAAGRCSTRPIALDGAGRLRNASAASLDWTGVTTKGAAPGTLILDGAGADNVMRDVTNGLGAVTVVKEGAGTWTLMGNVNATGGLEARGGTLEVDNRRVFSWFRLTVRDTWRKFRIDLGDTGTDTALMLSEFGLWSADGTRQNSGLAYSSAANGKHLLLEPGQACVGTGTPHSSRLISSLFDAAGSQYQAGGLTTDPADSNTWYRVVMRLPTDAAKAVKYDIGSGNSSSGTYKAYPYYREARSWIVEGSVDGVNWETLDEQDRDGDSKTPTVGSKWYSNSSAVTTANPPGFAFDITETELFTKMDEVAYVGVSGGGTVRAAAPITASALKVDAVAGGTVDGFAFPDSGTLEVVNAGARTSDELPVTFLNVTGLENVEGWTVTGDGVSSRTKIRLRSGRLWLMPPGTVLILR